MNRRILEQYGGSQKIQRYREVALVTRIGLFGGCRTKTVNIAIGFDVWAEVVIKTKAVVFNQLQASGLSCTQPPSHRLLSQEDSLCRNLRRQQDSLGERTYLCRTQHQYLHPK